MKNNTFGYLIIILLLFANSSEVFAQTNYLKKKISYSVSDTRLDKLLNDIEKLGGFMFSYNSQIIDVNRKVSLDAKNETIKSILDRIFNKKIQYKSIGAHIILTKRNFDKKTIKENKDISYTITGYIIDNESGEQIISATVYDLQANYSAITNPKGYFKLEIPADNEFRSINFSKRGYQDTIIIIKPKEEKQINIKLQAIEKIDINKVKAKEINISDSSEINNIKLVNLVVPEEAQTNAFNMEHLTQVRPFQVSFIPYAGNHMASSGHYTNKYSLNILAGYSGGVDGVELGGLLNMNRGRVRWLQIGGLGNIVGGAIEGVQMGGIFNTCRNGVSGVQIGGIFNHNMGAVNGVQVSGIFNDSQDSIRGAQIAGIANYHGGDITGAQVSGTFNYTKGDIKGAQLSGIANYCDKNIIGGQLASISNISLGNIDGVQLSIISNNSKNIEGIQGALISNITTESVDGFQASLISNVSNGNVIGSQASLISNITKEDLKGAQVSLISNVCGGTNNGIQLSLITNYAKNQNGLQIGLVNICDSIKGVSFGLLTFARHGYIDLELSYNEAFDYNLAFKTGGKHFYNIFLLRGSNSDNIMWGPGYGFGSSIGLNKNLNLSLELSSTHVNEAEEWVSELNLHNRFSVTLDWKIGKRFKIFTGPTYNVHVSNLKDPDTGNFNSSVAVNPFYTSSNNNTQVQMWIGGTIGVAF